MGRQIEAELELFESYLKGIFTLKRGGRFEHQAALRLVNSGGKRLRPRMLISCFFAGKYDRQKAFAAASSIEMIHTASLVHDDIIDNADFRRSTPTISSSDGNAVAVYTGDWLLAQSLIQLSEAELDTQASHEIAKAVRAMCSGEISQYLSKNKKTSASHYLKRVMKKTGLLFSACCAAGAKLSGFNQKDITRFAQFGLDFGVAFQIRDDILDIQSNFEQTGKPTGRDQAEGVITLPWLLPNGIIDASAVLEKYRTRCLAKLSLFPQSEGIDELVRLTQWL